VERRSVCCKREIVKTRTEVWEGWGWSLRGEHIELEIVSLKGNCSRSVLAG
jgi:hypothetical protein